MTALLEPLQYGFFQRGLIVATLAGALCGLVGVYVVLRSMSYIGHGLSHAVFGGAAISSVLGVSYFLGAGLWGVLAALMIGRVSGRRVIGADAAIGVVTTASFAIGLAIQSRSGAVSGSLDTVLFGNVLAVFRGDLIAIVVVGAAIAVFVLAFLRELTFSTFDPDVARTSGIRVDLLDAWFMVALSATVIVSVRVIGALLISAMLVIRRVPSRRRLRCTMRSTAAAVCSRIAFTGMSMPAIRTMVSRRDRASRGVLAWRVESEPS